MRDAEHGKEQRGQQNHAHRTPAIKGMEQAHNCVLIVKGARFHDGADQHFNQPAAHRVNHHADHHTYKWVRQHVRQKRQPSQTQCACDFRGNHAAAVSDRIHKAGAEQVNQQLREKKCGGDQRDLAKRDGVISVKLEKQ